MLDGDFTVWHDVSKSFSKWSFGRPVLDRLPLGHDALHSTAATRLSLRRCFSFFYFFFLKREDVPSPWSTTCFPLH
jgi:hypothetical protein